MKKYLSIISIISLLLFLTGCSFLIKRGTAWVMECEHGSLNVDVEMINSSEVKYTITAFPEEGYCLLRDNLYTGENRKKNIGSLWSNVEQISDNVFTITCNYDNSIIISAVFTKKEAVK